MRILMISDVYFPRINGVSTSIQSFIHLLTSYGHKVTLIAPTYGIDDSIHDAEINAHVIRIASRTIPIDPEDRLMRRKHILRHTHELQRHNYDIIHIHTPFVAHYDGVTLARALEIPVIETYHTYFEEYFHNYFKWVPKLLLKFVARHFSRSQAGQLDAMIVPSTLMYDVLLDYGITIPLIILPTGLEDSIFEPGNGLQFRQDHNIAHDRPVMCHVGRIAHEKNIDFLIEVLDKTRDTLPNILLLIAGEGPALNHLKQQVENDGLMENVMFLGYLDRHTELRDCYAAGDVFVFSSRTETQGLVLLEALAQGIPVVSTAVLGTVDILKPEKGAIIANEDVGDFSGKIIQVLTNMILRQQKARESIPYAHQWSAAKMTQQLVELYTEIIQGDLPDDRKPSKVA